MDPYPSRNERRKDDRPRNSRNDEHDPTPSQPKNRPSRKATRKSTSATDSEQSQARAGGQEGVLRNELPSRATLRGHDYQHVYTSGNVRAHFGDQYIEQQNILPRPAEETDETRKQRFMTDLGFNLMDSRLATIGAAHVNTCDWLFANESYLRWQYRRSRSSHHGVLWIKGKPGAGKSTLMKHALRHMQRHNRGRHTVLSYFFNARGHGLEKTTEGMYRSLLHQVFAKSPRRLPTPVPGYSTKWVSEGWPISMLQDWFRQAVLGFGSGRRFICYIDALDECDEESIRLAIHHLEELGDVAHSRGVHLSVCFASRHYPSISVKYHETINLDVEVQHHRDIMTFVSRRLHGERNLRRELGREISKRCSGVFLWAALVVQIVNKKTDRGATRSQLLAELTRVPDEIEELFQNLMSDHDIALLPTLQWVLFSKDPLRAETLYFAIMTSIGCLDTDTSDATNVSETQMRAFVLNSSKGLVEFIDMGSSDLRAQFIHETIREHLLSGGGLAALDSSLNGNVEAISHARIGQWCQEFMMTSIISKSRRDWRSYYGYSRRYMLDHLESAYSGNALDLRSIDGISDQIWLSWQRQFYFEAGSPHCDDENREATTSLYVLIVFRYTELAEAILQRRVARSQETSERAPTEYRRLKAFKTLSADVNVVCHKISYGTALLAAIYNLTQGVTYRVIELLLTCGADPNLAVNPGQTPLFVAMMYERLYPDSGIVKLLLQHGANPNIPVAIPIPSRRDERDYHHAVQIFNGTAYYAPSRLDTRNASHEVNMYRTLTVTHDEELFESLIDWKGNIEQSLMTSILCAAARYGSTSIVQLLLVSGANINDRGSYGRTALHESTYSQAGRDLQLAIARELLDAGMELDAMDDEGQTALTLAYRHESDDLARLFLDHGADLDLPRHREIARKLRREK
jgi:ankyrin repeat protein